MLVLAALLACQPDDGAGRSKPPEAEVVAAPPALDFGVHPTGEVQQTFELRNDGEAAADLTGLSVAGYAFRLIDVPTLPLELAPHDAVAVTVAYTPSAEAQAGTVRVLTDDAELSVPLTGGWALPALALTPPTLDFGTVLPWDYVEEALVLESVGAGTVAISEIAFLGEAYDFARRPQVPTVLAPGETLEIAVAFWPPDEGRWDGAVVVWSDVPDLALEAPLTGEALIPRTDHPMAFTATRELVDLVFVVDTSATTADALPTLVEQIGLAAADHLDGYERPTVGLASFEDYAGDAFGGEHARPFRLAQQQTTDLDRFDASLALVESRDGGHALSSAYEALHQALSGDGWDGACDGRYRWAEDVQPFVPRFSDAFGGVVDGVYDAAVPGTGAEGGVGLRDRAYPVFVLATGGPIRSPDTDASPGGCNQDAGPSDVAAGLRARGGDIVAIDLADDADGREQLESLASRADLDGDGVEEAAVLAIDALGVSAIRDAIAAVALSGMFSTVQVELVDPDGLVVGVTPPTLADVPVGDAVEFVFRLRGEAVDDPAAATGEVGVELVADGVVLQRHTLYVRQ